MNNFNNYYKRTYFIYLHSAEAYAQKNISIFWRLFKGSLTWKMAAGRIPAQERHYGTFFERVLHPQ